ncbi:MAG: hypothetical protein GSR80_000899 [Desulfurococcales archaeon]|nr:hypothetical protein [Desulfurococcales archaeon]
MGAGGERSAGECLEGLAESLGLGPLRPSSEEEIPSRRPEGLDAARAVREARREREERILGVLEGEA